MAALKGLYLAAAMAASLGTGLLSGPAAADRCPDTASLLADGQVHFDTGSDAISADERENIRNLAQQARTRHVTQVCLYGMASKQGDADYNRRLSQDRAEAVAAELRAAGVPADQI